MPYKTATRRPYVARKKKYPRRKTSQRVVSKQSAMMSKSEQGFNNSFVPALKTARYFSRLRYGAASINFTATTALVGTYVYSANGLYDPSISGGALQPAGFSQLITLYEHYTVYYAKISVIFTNNSTTPTMVGIALEPDTAANTDPSNMLELPFEQIVQLEGAPAYGSNKTVTLGVNLSKYFGENVLKTTSIYRGDAVSNPTEQVYFHCKAFGAKGGSADVFMNVKIEYSAMWTEPRELTASLNNKIADLILEDAKLDHKTNDFHAPPVMVQPQPIIVPDYTPRQRR